MLLSLASCSESDYKKIDNVFGLIPIPKDSVVLESGIKADTNDLTTFKASTYDSQRVAKKMTIVKNLFFKPIPQSQKGKTIAQLLDQQDDIGRREDAEFIKNQRNLLDSLYKSNSKNAKSITNKPDTRQ